MMNVLIEILVIGIVGGVIAWLLNRAPFLEGTIKSVVVWVVVAVTVILILLKLAAIAGV